MQQVEAARLFDRATKIDPFAQLPIVQGILRAVGAGKRHNTLAGGLGTSASEDRDFVSETDQFARQQPDERLDTRDLLHGRVEKFRQHLFSRKVIFRQLSRRAAMVFVVSVDFIDARQGFLRIGESD